MSIRKTVAEIFGTGYVENLEFYEQIINANLNEREKDILLRRILFNQEYKDIGKVYNVTRERIRQIESKALRKLQKQYPQQEESGWITSHQPTKNGFYLVSTNGEEFSDEPVDDVTFVEFYNGKWGFNRDEDITNIVQAWMPLPKPYKGKERLKEWDSPFRGMLEDEE